MFYVYVLTSLVKKMRYTGQTENLAERLEQHNAGKTKFTKSARPWEIVYHEAFETREEAVAREKFLKSGMGRAFLKAVIRENAK